MTSSIRVFVLLFGSFVATIHAGSFRAGAARIDITPAADAALPMSGYGGRTQGFRGIHDNVYVRAIVLDDGTTQAALVAWESLFVPDAVWTETSKRIAAESTLTAILGQMAIDRKREVTWDEMMKSA